MHESGDTCVASAIPSFDISALFGGALRKLTTSVEYMNTMDNNDEPQEQASPQSENSTSSSRKRRKGEVANPANTLDGLVARRADDGCEPIKKRYMTEQEAIEGPDDEIEVKRMQKDPDVSTRTCSTCGYQGKWVSEMIRHKRVHTSERPFKCRYCTRTSKWKADLIRHVAKTHGIRVVSKYSRSKTFDPQSTILQNRSELDKPRVFACDNNDPINLMNDMDSPRLYRPEPISPGRSALTYRCVHCLFEQEGLSVLLSHLRNVHNVAPYECRCGVSFENIDAALSHSKHSLTCTSNDLIVNVTPTYYRSNKVGTAGSISSASPSASSGERDSSPEFINQNEEGSERSSRTYSSSEEEVRPLSEQDAPYKCLFCPWKCSRLGDMESHLRLHSQLPNHFIKATPSEAQPQPGSHLQLLSAILALQSQLNPAYLTSMTNMLYMAPSAFTPVLAPTSFSTPTFEPTSVVELPSEDVVDVEK